MAKKQTTDPAATERALTTMQIADELQALTAKIIEQEGELKEGDLEALDKWNLALENKAENIGLYKSRMEAEIEHFKRIEEAARARRKALEGTIDRLRNYLARAMETAGIKKLKKLDGLFSISLVDGRESVRIADVTQLPLDLVEERTIIEPRKDIIKERLAAGEVIPGATLERGERFVLIK